MEDWTVVTYYFTDTSKALEPITEAEETTINITSGHQRAESVPPERISFRAAAVCLGLLCVLLLAGIIGLGLCNVNVIDEKIRKSEQMNTRDNNTLTELMTVNTRYNNTLTELMKMNTRYNNILTELMKENQYLVRETDELQKKLNNMYCSPSWQKLSCSCYYVSKERNTWERSRQDCRDRGADLVIITSRQELDFLHNFKKSFWIGLSDSEEEGIWKWVDETRLPEEHQFWRSGEPNGKKTENCVEQGHSRPETSWNDLPCSHTRLWVCEKNITL